MCVYARVAVYAPASATRGPESFMDQARAS